MDAHFASLYEIGVSYFMAPEILHAKVSVFIALF